MHLNQNMSGWLAPCNYGTVSVANAQNFEEPCSITFFMRFIHIAGVCMLSNTLAMMHMITNQHHGTLN